MATSTLEPDPRPNEPPAEFTRGPFELVLMQDGKVLYQFHADQFAMFDDIAICDPEELAKMTPPQQP
jgi:hypothetical protein